MAVEIRPYQPTDAEAIATLFFETVRTVNLGDYTQQQVEAWAFGKPSAPHWVARLADLTTFIAVIGDKVVGFATLRADGYVDHLFAHHEHQRQGVATHLHAAVERHARTLGASRLFTHASITAKPFFLRAGYTQVKQQTVTIRGVDLTNFVMEKPIRQ